MFNLKSMCMRIRNYLFLFVLFCLIAMNTVAQSDKGIVQGVIRVKLRPEMVASTNGLSPYVSNGKLVSGIVALDNANSTFSASSMQRVFRYSPKNEDLHRKHGLHLWYEIRFNAKVSSAQAVQAYNGIAGVERAEPLYQIVSFDKDAKYNELTKSLVNNTKLLGTMPFNDPALPDQWHYNNTGQYGGTAGMDINLFPAWTITGGKSNVVVAVTDQGVDYTHEDLAANMWVNQAELNGVQGKDDDGNGFIDDIHGFNFTTNYGDVDKGQHGTHVAGTIAAVNNNGIGVSGVAGGTGHSDGARIMSCEILGSGDGSAIEESYIYAADNGAVISQNSWGYNGGDGGQAIYDAIDYFIAEAGNFPNSPMKGGVVIFAAGNNATNQLSWPGCYSKVVCVAALGARGEATEYTNYGAWVDIAAPGGSSNVNARQGVLSAVPGNKYAYMDGTSMACPHVSGVAALVVSKYGGADFKNTFLVNHLLTGIRKDIYGIDLNQNFIDSLGVGAIDAKLALAVDNKVAPNAITDFKLNGISNDFANVSWSVPTDDDGKPWYFRLLYSTDNQFTNPTVIEIVNKSEIGQTISSEIDNLAGSTQYYFAVQSIDRWGNVSEMSNIVSGKTNEGPKTVIAPETLSPIAINVSNDKTGKATFSISNIGAGILKYTIGKFHQSNEDLYSKPSIVYPSLPKSLTFSKTTLGSNAYQSNQRVEPLNQKPINPDIRKDYTSTSYGGYILGETDTSYNNSAALRFYVDEAKGFNLTNIDAFLKLDRSKGPAVIEIYSGKEIAKAKLIYAQNYLVSTWASGKAENHYIKLEDQIYFPQRTYFWIVVHAPHGQLYPLGANREYEKGMAANAYYSKSLGKSWEKLVDIFWDNQLVWAFTAISNLEPLGNYITLSADKGTVNAAENSEITINVDATKLINGTYNEDLIIYTNEASRPLIKVPYAITVDNQKPVIVTPEIVDFGSLVVGLEKKIDVVIPNIGLGKLKNLEVSFSNNDPEQFTKTNWISEIAAEDKGTLTIKYKPTVAGTINSVVTITGTDQDIPDANNVSYTFVINAVAINPPVISIDPISASYPNLVSGAVVNGSVTISNTGVYPLKYYVPGKSKSNLTGESKYVHKYGYYFVKNNANYQWNDISTTGTEVTEKVKNSSKRNSFYQVPLNFNFPFFGVKEDSAYLTRFGFISFTKDGSLSRMPMAFKDGDTGWGTGNPTRFVSALGALAPDMSLGGHIHYQQYIDRFVVQYTGMKETENGGEMTYQIVLYENGDIRYYYNTVGWDSWALESEALIDIEDLSIDDALCINDNDYNSPYYAANIPTSGDVFEIKSPGMGIITSVDKPNGVVASGASVTVNYSINTSGLPEGNFIEKLNFISNDPQNPALSHNIDLSVVGGGVANVSLINDAVNFGDVAITGAKTMRAFIQNTGTKNVKITSAQLNNSNYDLIESHTDLNGGRTLPFVIKMNTSTLGAHNATLTIITDEPKTYTVQITGNIIDKASITADVTLIEKTLASGGNATVQVKVTNNGNNTLEYNPVGNQWLQVDHYSIESNSLTSDYKLTKSRDASNNCVFTWEDIVSTGTKVESLEHFWEAEENYWATIKLPWTFDFYGNKYDSISIGATGVLSFAKELGRNFIMGPQTGIPDASIPNDYISAIYSFGGLAGKSEFPRAGYYYQIFEDKVIIEFSEFYNNFGMGEPMTCEAILYKDGRIKLQYLSTNFINLSFGLIGIENRDGSEGIEVSNREMGYIKALDAYMFTPVKKHTLAAGASENLNITVDAKNIFAGTYNGKLSLENNTPDNATYSIPATLTVTGNPIASVSTDNVNFGEVFAYRHFNTDYYQEMWKFYTKNVSIKNTGTAAMVINSLAFDANVSPVLVAGINVYDPWWGLTFTDISMLNYPITVQPNDSLTLNVYLFHPNFASSLEAPFDNVNNVLSVNIDGNPTTTIPVTATIKAPPMMEVDKKEVAYSTNTSNYTVSDAVQVTNKQAAGGGDLKYSVKFVYQRNTAKATSTAKDYSKVRNQGTLVTQSFTGKQTPDILGGTTYNRTLEYSTETAPSNKIGYGGGYQFGAATAFTAPADGFNLTHVSTWYASGSALTSRIFVEIRGGSNNPNDADVLYSQAYDFTTTQIDKEGKLHTIKLDKNIRVDAT